MKKSKLIFVLMTCMMLAFALASCGGSEDEDTSADSEETTAELTLEDDIVGDWVLTTIVDAEGNEYTLEEYCEAQGVDTEGVEATYTFNDDGTGTAAIGGIGTDLTYEVSDDTLSYTVTDSGTTAEMTYVDGILCSVATDDSGMESYFEKQ